MAGSGCQLCVRTACAPHMRILALCFSWEVLAFAPRGGMMPPRCILGPRGIYLLLALLTFRFHISCICK